MIKEEWHPSLKQGLERNNRLKKASPVTRIAYHTAMQQRDVANNEFNSYRKTRDVQERVGGEAECRRLWKLSHRLVALVDERLDREVPIKK